MTIEHWLLPDGVEDILPETALKIEHGRRSLIDLFGRWGYEHVMPAKLEFLESLLTGTGRDLDLKTFKVIDQLSGRMMGLPADLTPQVARIDAHSLGQEGPTRLCYADFVLHSRPDHMLASRNPLKVGAEYFGDASLQADIEIISLMLSGLESLDLGMIQLELGDVSFFRALVAEAQLDPAQERAVFDLVQNKAKDELSATITGYGVSEPLAALIAELPMLSGDSKTLQSARRLLSDRPLLLDALDHLTLLSAQIAERYPSVVLSFDLSELRGLHYHTGLVFSVFLPDSGQVVAKGGRYDNIGAVFGRARPATGFDVELLTIADRLPSPPVGQRVSVVRHEAGDLAALWQITEDLRQTGVQVIEGALMPRAGDQELVWIEGAWQVRDR
ncbi:MAG: ATP phosphoribosyltransferase regulatory subunit [Gammaproteobacteria bacterium TMED95]|nr:ATP phosphoribosyltransferase regulatory subunit [Gammaproteobacteria bacterium]OUV21108.1 MAG: ATP phosphoribosyltransferase regulatory subunit [Gammaproteobacteria bacterium TMED95]|tara:strand:+ start:954 stop:2117 length:1164 start_codon:yes stop_codon:yes gene_type:complete